MAERKFFRARNIIIIIISIILLAASVAGITIFLKDKGEAEAAEQGLIDKLPVAGENGGNNGTGENNSGTGEEVVTPVTPGTQGTAGSSASSGTTGGSSQSGTLTEEEILSGITETVVEQERKVYEDLKLSWTTISIPTIKASMGIYKPELQIEKTATGLIKADKPDETIEIDSNNIPMVRPGDLVIYTIKVSNTGNYKATNVIVTEALDVMFDGKEVKDGETLVKLETLDYGKVATLKVAYEVTQGDIEATEILNEVEVPKNIENKVYATDGRKETEDEDDTVPVNPDIADITGKKTWVDNKDNNTRPESIMVNVLADGVEVAEKEVKPDANGEWKYEFTNLPKYNDKKEEIVYTITEDELDDYTYQVVEGTYDIKNTIKQKIVSLSGTKTWIDEANTTHDKIILTVYQNGSPFKIKVGNQEVPYIYELEDGETDFIFENLPKYKVDSEGKYILDDDGYVQLNEYTVVETTGQEGYVASYDEEPAVDADGNFTQNVTNTIKQETVSLSGTKTWVDPENTTHDKIILTVYQNGSTFKIKVGDKEVPYIYELEDGDKDFIFENLPKYKVDSEGKYILDNDGNVQLNKYTVVETTGQNGYEVSYDKEPAVDADGNFTQNVTNTIKQETVSLSGTKTWIDEANTTHDKIILTVYQNGSPFKIKVGDQEVPYIYELEDGDTDFIFENLPKYKVDSEGKYKLDSKGNVELNKYTVVETTGQNGYEVSYDKEPAVDADGNFTQNVTNTKENEEISITVNKVWVDENIPENRPTITIGLYKNNNTTPEKTITIENDDELSYTFTDLEKYSFKKDGDGNIISCTENKYVIKEVKIGEETVENGKANGYKVEEGTLAQGQNNNEFTQTITNTADPEATATVTVYKEWVTPHVMTHPDIHIQLYQNGVAYGNQITLSAGTDGVWEQSELQYTWTNLPKYKLNNGELVIENGVVQLNKYTVREVDVDANVENLIQYITTYSDDIVPYNEEETTPDNEKTITNTAKGVIETVTYETTMTTYTRPVDVVLVLDTSGSMAEANTEGNSKAKDMVTAVNETITTIMKHNPLSKVAVVTYSNSATTILPLGRYEPLTTDTTDINNPIGIYLTCAQGSWSSNSGKYSNVSISTNVKGAETQNTVSVTGATYIQGGIATGANILIGADTAYDPDGAEGPEPATTRIPIMLLLSDGEPTKRTTSYDNVGNSTGGSGSSSSYWDAYYTIRTADAYKAKIEEHYGDANFYTIGYGADTLLLRTVLNPYTDNIDECKISKKNSKTKKLYDELAKTTAGAYGYNYADGSYTSGKMSSTELSSLLNHFIHSSVPSTEYRIFTRDEIIAGKVYLNKLDDTDGFSLTYGNKTYLDLQDAIDDGLVILDTTNNEYYLDLKAIYMDLYDLTSEEQLQNIQVSEQIYVKYHEKKS